MQLKDIKANTLYKKCSTGLVVKVKNFELKDCSIKMNWQVMSMPAFVGYVFSDDVSKIDFSDWVEEKNFEKYD